MSAKVLAERIEKRDISLDDRIKDNQSYPDLRLDF